MIVGKTCLLTLQLTKERVIRAAKAERTHDPYQHRMVQLRRMLMIPDYIRIKIARQHTRRLRKHLAIHLADPQFVADKPLSAYAEVAYTRGLIVI
jgi:hypothetical protein